MKVMKPYCIKPVTAHKVDCVIARMLHIIIKKKKEILSKLLTCLAVLVKIS